jgi:hypothetical protein
LLDALNAVQRLTPPASKILPVGAPLAVRYHALRPVVYAWKDGGSLSYANHEALWRWYDRTKQFRAAKKEKDPYRRLERLIALGREFGAGYLFLHLREVPENPIPAGVDALFLGRRFALIRIPQQATDPPKGSSLSDESPGEGREG